MSRINVLLRIVMAVFGLAGIFALIAGCTDPLARQNVLTTVFDGVPDLPPVEVLCEEHMGEKYKEFYDALAEAQQRKEGQSEEKPGILSSHMPYAEKNCQGCHDFKAANLLIAPANELCFVCHKNFIQGPNVHGPVAVGDCLACHVPHDSKYTSLLQQERSTICTKCHIEKRLAENMHIQVISHNMDCVDCHDPHSGVAHYFLK